MKLFRPGVNICTATNLVGAHELFELQAYPTLSHGKSYIFYELPIRINLYEWPTPNPAPKPTRHWGLDKSY